MDIKNNTMLQYNLVQLANPQKRTQTPKWYAVPASRGRKSINDLCADIAGSSSLSRGDIYNVLMGLVDQLPKYLLDGYSAELGELGLLRISFSSEGVDNPTDFTTNKIAGVKILFLPDKGMKKMLQRSRFGEEE